jgi:signal transduction histidine kinase
MGYRPRVGTSSSWAGAASTLGQVTAHPNVRERVDTERLVEEQAALRRVATLVARGGSPGDVFEAVAAEVARLLGSDFSLVGRYEADATLTHIASHPLELLSQLGPRTVLDGEDLASVVQRSGRPTCIDYDHAPGQVAALARELGVRCAVGAPILVNDRTWGVMAAGWAVPEKATSEAAERTAEFTELVATALANNESRDEITRLADEQAALRRVATLVARGAPPAELFEAVVTEIGQLFPEANAAALSRYETDDMLTMIGKWSRTEGYVPVAEHYPLAQGTVGSLIDQTRLPGRVDVDSEAFKSLPAVIRDLGWVSVVGAPIIVEGRLWGLVGVSSTTEQPLPPSTEERLTDFTELVATAIANAESRAELTASRARIVAAGDEARRRIERDLHDGTQQRLVSLALAARAAATELPPGSRQLRGRFSSIAAGLGAAVEELQELSRGIHPAILSDAGLGPALESLALRSPIPVDLEVMTRERFPQPVEAAAYFAASESLANAAKHSQASRIDVALELENQGLLLLSVCDDGIGGADPGRGSGLVGLRDRVEALGGSLEINSKPGEGTSIAASLPLRDDRSYETGTS